MMYIISSTVVFDLYIVYLFYISVYYYFVIEREFVKD